jgi:hypothetical protein
VDILDQIDRALESNEDALRKTRNEARLEWVFPGYSDSPEISTSDLVVFASHLSPRDLQQWSDALATYIPPVLNFSTLEKDNLGDFRAGTAIDYTQYDTIEEAWEAKCDDLGFTPSNLESVLGDLMQYAQNPCIVNRSTSVASTTGRGLLFRDPGG